MAAFTSMSGVGCTAQPGRGVEIAESRQIKVGDAVVQVDFARGAMDLPVDAVLAHIQAAVSAVTTYYGRFPVATARILIIPVEDRHGILQGTTWGNIGGFQGFTRIRIGQHTTTAELAEDWMMTHELVHMAFPSLPDDQHWMEEGQATYIEPIARVMTGELKPQQIWQDMFRDMAKGEAGPGDEGLDHTHTWGRTYWGGALFCLLADIGIRKNTANAQGLQDALRAINRAGGTIEADWPLERALETGDKATDGKTLMELYRKMRAQPAMIDLPDLWTQLGVARGADGSVAFDTRAPLAGVREAIMRGGDGGRGAT